MLFEMIKSAVSKAATELSLDDYEIYYKEGADTSVETLNKSVSAFSSSAYAGVCVRVVIDGRIGYAATELIEEEEIKKLVFRAAENAKAVERADDVGIYKGGKEYNNNVKKEFIALSESELKKIATEIADKAYGKSAGVSEGTESSAGASTFTVRIANSYGLDLENSGGVNYINASVIYAQGDERESGYEVMEYHGEDEVDYVVDSALNTAKGKIGAQKLKSGKYNLVIDPKRMRQLLSAYSSVFSAKNAQSGLSLLKGKEGQKVASEIVTITDDPCREGACVTTPFDAEGMPTYRKSVIEKGVLKTLLYNRETAKKAGCMSTANGGKSSYASPISTTPYAFCIEAGDKTPKELFDLAGDGILITALNGMHAGTNAATGDFSLESAGFLIKDGKICQPVKSFTVSGNFFELLKQISAISNRVELSVSGSATTFGSPYVLIPDMSVAGE